MSIILTMYYWNLISSFWEGYNKDILNVLVG